MLRQLFVGDVPQQPARKHATRACRQLAESLLGAIVQHNRKDTGEFVMITGVSDSTCFNDDKSWEQPAEMQDRCYVGMPLTRCGCRAPAGGWWQLRWPQACWTARSDAMAA